MSATFTIVNAAALREARAAVFRRRESTIDDEARRYTLRDWEHTLRHYTAAARATVERLPESAFQPQPDDPEGNPVWSAGQIVGHLFEAQVNIFFRAIRQAAGIDAAREATELTTAPLTTHTDREDALAILTAADDDIDALFAHLNIGIDLTAQHDIEPFGQIGIGGLLMFAAIHAEDHATQLGELR
ncbi:MAG: hypothetical protein DCC58_05990 [Chloroflexi bacterium]|nr:MAG: hypothetical protein DCC58_05990 [Chloroflexota bacterium]